MVDAIGCVTCYLAQNAVDSYVLMPWQIGCKQTLLNRPNECAACDKL